MIRTPLTLAAALALAAPALADSHMAGATARLTSADGADRGEVTLIETPKGVLVKARLTGLPEGWHGFHIHESGACSPDFEAAGDHANPLGAEHGFMNEAGPHLGDMPNVYVHANGEARADAFVWGATLRNGEAMLLDEDGAAVIVHENPDSYESEAGAGGRIACGVIEPN